MYRKHSRSFEVESLNFPGQQHKWLLSQLLQKGTERTKESLMNDLALALRFILVTARGRILSHFFSIAQAVRVLLVGLIRILDLTIGVPSLQAHNLDAKIREERCKYLVAELVCRVRFDTLHFIFYSKTFVFSRKMRSLSKCFVRSCVPNSAVQRRKNSRLPVNAPNLPSPFPTDT